MHSLEVLLYSMYHMEYPSLSKIVQKLLIELFLSDEFKNSFLNLDKSNFDGDKESKGLFSISFILNLGNSNNPGTYGSFSFCCSFGVSFCSFSFLSFLSFLSFCFSFFSFLFFLSPLFLSFLFFSFSSSYHLFNLGVNLFLICSGKWNIIRNLNLANKDISAKVN